MHLWQVIYFPSRPGYTDPHVKRRVLDYLLFMNSKVTLTDLGCQAFFAVAKCLSLSCAWQLTSSNLHAIGWSV